MKTLTELLREGRARIERGWCQNHLAVDSNGVQTDPDGPEAVAWCAFGASSYGTVDQALRTALSAIAGTFSVASWNDKIGRTRADVLGLYDKAIELAKKGLV